MYCAMPTPLCSRYSPSDAEANKKKGHTQAIRSAAHAVAVFGKHPESYSETCNLVLSEYISNEDKNMQQAETRQRSATVNLHLTGAFLSKQACSSFIISTGERFFYKHKNAEELFVVRITSHTRARDRTHPEDRCPKHQGEALRQLWSRRECIVSFVFFFPFLSLLLSHTCEIGRLLKECRRLPQNGAVHKDPGLLCRKYGVHDRVVRLRHVRCARQYQGACLNSSGE